MSEQPPRTEDELLAYIRSVITEGTDYNGSAEALWKCALAAFEYAAHKVGATGFQGEWAALRFYGEALGIDCPYAVIRAEDLVYPQYDLSAKVAGYIKEWQPWARGKARERLAEYEADAAPIASAHVVDHWRRLAGESA